MTLCIPDERGARLNCSAYGAPMRCSAGAVPGTLPARRPSAQAAAPQDSVRKRHAPHHAAASQWVPKVLEARTRDKPIPVPSLFQRPVHLPVLVASSCLGSWHPAGLVWQRMGKSHPMLVLSTLLVQFCYVILGLQLRAHQAATPATAILISAQHKVILLSKAVLVC